jgi:large subunit ribosomal protein LP1
MSLYGAQKDEFVTSIAALCLYDGDAEITSENISTLLAATNNTVAPYWPVLFAGLLKNGRIETLVFSAGGGGGGGGGGGAAAAGNFATQRSFADAFNMF